MIRYDKKLNKEIQKVIYNYNAKIRRLKKSGKNDIIIPEKLVPEEVLNSLKSLDNRKEVKRRLEDLKEFTSRGGEKIIKDKGISQAQYNQIKRYRRILSRRINKDIKFYQETKPTTRGKKDNFNLAIQFNSEYQNLISRKEKLIDVDFFKMSKQELKEYLFKLQANTKEIDHRKWQEGYIEILTNTGKTFGVSDKDIDDIKEKLLKLKPRDFYKLSKTENLIKEIVYYYKRIKKIKNDKDYDDLQDDAIGIFKTLREDIEIIVKDYIK